MTLEFLLQDFPEWAIPYTNIVPVFHSENGVDMDADDLNFSYTFSHFFQKIDDTNFKLKIDVDGVITQSGITHPLFVSVKMVILNENVYNTVQHNRGN